MNVCICVPCYRESQRLPAFIADIRRVFSSSQTSRVTLYFLDDGSGEFETKLMRAAVDDLKDNSHISFHYVEFPENRGKGAVLRDGFANAMKNGFDLIGFFDGDGATPAKEILNLIHQFEHTPESDVVVGSRWKALGHPVERSFKRHLSGRIFATILSILYSIPIYDSQCGAKLFRKRVLTSELLALCDNQNWLFDTQLIITLHSRGRDIFELPVVWKDQPGSKINLIRDSFRMFWGLLIFRRKLRIKSVT